MLDQLALRGPDAEGTWADEHALLLFRRLSVIDLAGGGQPMVSPEGAVLAYTGEVFNFAALRAELRALGHHFGTASDSEVVLRAYLQWGERCAERFTGMFAFAVWDARKHELLLIRDRFGIYPLYYARLESGLVFGSEPKAVLAHPGVRAQVDLDGLRKLLSFAPVPGQGVFRGVFEVLPGSVVRFSEAGLTSSRYWWLAAAPHTDDLPTTIASVRELLEESVRAQVVADVPWCVQLSGGLDSSALAALASRVVGAPIATYSLDFAGHAERFRAGELYSSPDAPFAAEMVKWLGCEHTELVLDSAQLLDDATRRDVVRALDMPSPGGEMYTSLYLLAAVIRQRHVVTLSGDAADEIFGGFVWYQDEWYRNSQTFPWLLASHRMELLTGLLDRDLVNRLDLQTFSSDHYRSALAEVEGLPGESALDRRMREMTYVNLTRYLPVVLERKDRMAMASALEGRVPYADHRLVEYVYNTPWAMRSFDGREKSLLRAAVKDLLPQSVLERVKAPFPTTQDPAYAAGLRAKLEALLADSASPAWQLLDRQRVAKAVLGPDATARLGVTRLSLDLATQLHDWLTSGIRLVV
ncbi:asparagine synthetase B [Rhizocola hellebori]|uniref:asparagine synthase (glutamine-hydrolyzing) n=2 Tax=Rhizocola hellebori TaxID=1392758 RepID=A0A8J3VBV8_9ACTN|nr:asparagine synthetase B [Rhizocola hellebori]